MAHEEMITDIPVTIIRQGGEPVIIGEATVNADGEISGHVERDRLDAYAEENLGNVSFAMSLPTRILRRLVEAVHPHKPGRHEKH
jgi:hypothetical protein